VTPAAITYELALPCHEARAFGLAAPIINTYVERRDGRIRPILTLLDTEATISVVAGRVAITALGFDPRADPLDVVPLSGFAAAAQRLTYVHELRCLFGGYDQFAELTLHVAFTDPDEAPLAFNVLGREGLAGDRSRGFFSQVDFGYRHRVVPGPPEVYMSVVR
jgi:hypothetical protein